MIRVTDQARYRFPRRYLPELGRRQARLQAQLASGLRVARPSDDPLGARQARLLDSQLAGNRQYLRSIDRADALLRQADAALGEGINGLGRASELLIGANNGVLTDADAGVIAQELDDLRAQLGSVANTQLGGTYLFGGYRTDAPPYDDQRAFAGDASVVQVEVGRGLRQAVGLRGGAAFGDGTPATVDVFDALTRASAAVLARDAGAVEAELAALQAATEQLIDGRAQVGVELQRVAAAASVQSTLAVELPRAIAAVVEADLPATISELSQTESALQATLAASARALNGASLMDFLR